MPNYDDGKELKCSFCGKPQSRVRKLIAGPNVYICDECIGVCTSILDDELDLMPEYEPQSHALEKPEHLPTPQELKKCSMSTLSVRIVQRLPFRLRFTTTTSASTIRRPR